MEVADKKSIRDLLRQQPEDRDVHRAIEDAGEVGRDAAKRLAMGGEEGDIVILMLGKNGKIHPKDYGRTG